MDRSDVAERGEGGSATAGAIAYSNFLTRLNGDGNVSEDSRQVCGVQEAVMPWISIVPLVDRILEKFGCTVVVWQGGFSGFVSFVKSLKRETAPIEVLQLNPHNSQRRKKLVVIENVDQSDFQWLQRFVVVGSVTANNEETVKPVDDKV